ncbi:MAG: hypothetical protein EB127_07765 [Alphaproteobacteria bacterium]|nr:hypothetical protein [Alphaproteobacteria bacterium]
MKHTRVSFDQVLSYQYTSLASPHLNGCALNYLNQIADFECDRLYKSKDLFSDYEGSSIIRAQIARNFYPNYENNIILKSNIYDFISMILRREIITELHIPNNLPESELVYDYINQNSKSDRINFIIDPFGLDLSRIDNPNIILFSSIEELYGIEGVNLCWLVSKNENLLREIRQELRLSGPSCSIMAEIYALIALRNHSLIDAQNKKILKENLVYIYTSLKKNDWLKMQVSSIYPFATIRFPDKDGLIYHLKKYFSILLLESPFAENEIIIHIGKKKFIPEFSIFLEAMRSFMNQM